MERTGDLTKYMGKKLSIQLNGSRKVIGILIGSDPDLNLTMQSAVEESQGDKISLGTIVIRGNSIVSMEALEHV